MKDPDGDLWQCYLWVFLALFFLFMFFCEKFDGVPNKSMVPVRKVQGHPWEAKQ